MKRFFILSIILLSIFNLLLCTPVIQIFEKRLDSCGGGCTGTSGCGDGCFCEIEWAGHGSCAPSCSDNGGSCLHGKDCCSGLCYNNICQ
uniref:Defensin-like protein n=1 Tax=Acrobeloides nanus TaxID=290746 RepID=A0A914EKS9_9BILA